MLDLFEQRLVAHVHGIKPATRKSFQNTMEIAYAFYVEAKKFDDSLPEWNVCKDVKIESASDKDAPHLRENLRMAKCTITNWFVLA